MDEATERKNAFRAYWDALGTTEPPSQKDFDDAYLGVYSSFEEYVDENFLMESMTDGWPQDAITYFDKKKWVEELELNYLVAEGEEEAYGVKYRVVYVFSEN